MKLTDLEPRWFDVPGLGTDKDGVTFLCPCQKCGGKGVRLAAQFANPVGGGVGVAMTQKEKIYHVHTLGTFDVPPGFLWQRTGETFETLSLHPSIDASPAGHWHGYITNGEAV
jgi:hypothetical protein